MERTFDYKGYIVGISWCNERNGLQYKIYDNFRYMVDYSSDVYKFKKDCIREAKKAVNKIIESDAAEDE